MFLSQLFIICNEDGATAGLQKLLNSSLVTSTINLKAWCETWILASSGLVGVFFCETLELICLSLMNPER